MSLKVEVTLPCHCRSWVCEWGQQSVCVVMSVAPNLPKTSSKLATCTYNAGLKMSLLFVAALPLEVVLSALLSLFSGWGSNKLGLSSARTVFRLARMASPLGLPQEEELSDLAAEVL